MFFSTNGKPKDGSFEQVIASDLDEARRVRDAIECQLQALAYDDHEVFGIKLALEEALVNAIKHGNGMDASKRVRIRGCITAQRFEIRISDEGPGFDPRGVPDPLASENLERPNGRGLLLMRHYMSEVLIHPPGNHIFMCKNRDHVSVRG